MAGRFLKWNRDEYEADKTRVRSTSLKLFVKTPQGPRAYYRAVVAPEPTLLNEDEQRKEETKKRNLIVGTLLHELLLEGKQDWFVTESRRGSKQWLDEADEHGEQRLIKPREEREILVMRDAVMRNKQCAALLKAGGLSEQTVAWEEEIDGQVIECKCRIDWLTDSGIIVDLKSSMAKERWQFHEQIWEYGYDFSAAYYARGLLSVPEYHGHRVKFLHLVVNKLGYAYLWPLDPQWLAAGNRSVTRALKDLAWCRNNEKQGLDPDDAWPDLQEKKQLMVLGPNEWQVAQLDSISSTTAEAELLGQ